MNSFIKLKKFLLSQKDASLCLLSERFCQDPLENYFGQQKSRGRRSDNPSVKGTIHNAMAIQAQKSLQLDHVRGNCQRKCLISQPPQVTEEDNVPLPKRKRTTRKH